MIVVPRPLIALSSTPTTTAVRAAQRVTAAEENDVPNQAAKMRSWDEAQAVSALSMDFGVFDHPRPAVDEALAAQITLDHYGVRGTAEPLAGERDRSFKINR